MSEPEEPTATLIVYTYYSDCGNCGRQAHPSAVRHDVIAGYGDKKPGCGALFTAITSGMVGVGGMNEALRVLRPDLPLVDRRTYFGLSGDSS